MKETYIDLMEACLSAYSDEHILEEDVFGVLTEFFRKDKHYYCTDEKYIRYAEKRLKTYKIRRFFVIMKARFIALCKKIVKPFRKKK
jgi:hypothetical protein